MLESVEEFNSGYNDFLLKRILKAMDVVDRKFFVENENPYVDTALFIGEGQTISQPSTVARMLLLADLKKGDNVLEIGAGSGWNASLISFLVYPGKVISVERIKSLIEKAEENVSFLKKHLNEENKKKLDKINFFAENIFSKGKVWKQRYDKIIITAGIEHRQENRIEKIAKSLLKDKGILICPYISGPILIYKKEKKEIKKQKTREEYVFVPLLS